VATPRGYNISKWLGWRDLKNKRIKGNTLLEAVCKTVHERREVLGISQEELAHRAGLHRTYISDIERGARNPSLKTLSRLADALEISTSDLIRLGESKSNESASGSSTDVIGQSDFKSSSVPS
jgi:ribosome-binding protein aMBF1 (putative translation factor)